MRKRTIAQICGILGVLAVVLIWASVSGNKTPVYRQIPTQAYLPSVTYISTPSPSPTPMPSPTLPPPPAHKDLDHYALRTEAEIMEELGESFGPYFGKYPKITFLGADMSYTECYLMRYPYDEYYLYFYLVEIDGEMRAVRSHIWVRQQMEEGVPKMDATYSREDVERLTGIALPTEEERSPVRAIWRDAGEAVHEIYADKASIAPDLYDIVVTYMDGLFMDTKLMEIPGAKLRTAESPDEPEIEVLMTAKEFSLITEEQLVEWMGPPWEILELNADGYNVGSVEVVYYTYCYGNYEYEFTFYEFSGEGWRLIEVAAYAYGLNWVSDKTWGAVKLTPHTMSVMLDQYLAYSALYIKNKKTGSWVWRDVSEKIYSIDANGGIGWHPWGRVHFKIRYAKHILHDTQYLEDAIIRH